LQQPLQQRCQARTIKRMNHTARPRDESTVEAIEAPAPVPNPVAALAVGASTSLSLRSAPTLRASTRFFEHASEQLLWSTKLTQELAGSVFIREAAHGSILCGLKREMAGKPGRVAIDPQWGSLLWHTHPGIRGSLAAFSNEDIDVAKRSGKPLLVIGFGGLSVDVLSTLVMPFGMRALLLGAAVKGVLSLEKVATLAPRLLRLGVAARVCYPDGRIAMVRRIHSTPLQRAVEQMSFALDRGVGRVERTGQLAVKRVIDAVLPR
jgi:hypothetical protein